MNHLAIKFPNEAIAATVKEDQRGPRNVSKFHLQSYYWLEVIYIMMVETVIRDALIDDLMVEAPTDDIEMENIEESFVENLDA